MTETKKQAQVKDPPQTTKAETPFVTYLKAHRQELVIAGLISAALIGLMLTLSNGTQGGLGGFWFANPYLPDTSLLRFIMIGLSGSAGFLIGWFFSDKGKSARLVVMLTVALVGSFAIFMDNGSIGWGLAMIGAVIAFFAALGYWSGKAVKQFMRPPTTFGDSKFADEAEIEEAGLFDGQGYHLGSYPTEDGDKTLTFAGQRHMITCAPTQYGKGVSSIIPNLLSYQGSAVVIDPKGENAMVTAQHRANMGQKVYVLDAFGITGFRSARLNPLDMLKQGDVELTENAFMLADAIITQMGTQDVFWTEEAKALLQGVMTYVATDEQEDGQRTLGRVRDLLLLDGVNMRKLFERMLQSPYKIVRATAARCLQKEEKLLSNVLASVQAQTHFLDSASLRENLSVSDFDFADLKTTPMTVYIVLPSDRLNSFSPWLRLLIQQALTVNARNIEKKPKKPVLFLLDEMAALGKLSMVEQAFGLMAGYGIQLWAIVQDLSQLKRIYGDGWETFIANAGMIQYFGSRDVMTAEYFSKLSGVTTVWNFSSAIARTLGTGAGGGSSSTGTTDTTSATQRSLLYPDQLMRMDQKKQLVLIDKMNPVIATKTPWFTHPRFKTLGRNLHDEKK